MSPKSKTLRELAGEGTPLDVYAAQLKSYEKAVDQKASEIKGKAERLREQAKNLNRVCYTDESVMDGQRRQLEVYRAALAPFADLIPATMRTLPRTTKFAPKLTLEPFLAAHRALYGLDVESP